MPTVFSDLVLVRSDRGTVLRCPCCGDPELRFDGVGVTLTPGELRKMRATLQAAQDEADRRRPVGGWALRAETLGQTAYFHLYGDDVDALADLLAQAEAVLDLDALFLDTLGPRPTA